jgi:hypothetical protein
MLPISKKYPLACYQLNNDFIDINHDFMELYQMPHYNAVLVRPDGHIVWRS